MFHENQPNVRHIYHINIYIRTYHIHGSYRDVAFLSQVTSKITVYVDLSTVSTKPREQKIDLLLLRLELLSFGIKGKATKNPGLNHIASTNLPFGHHIAFTSTQQKHIKDIYTLVPA